MALRDDIPALIQTWKNQASTIKHNADLFDIFEGNLLPHVLEDLKAQLSESAFKEASKRVAPINVLKRLIDKLSKIYVKPPVRAIDGASASDEKLLADYVEEMDANTQLGSADGANGFFNLFKSVWVKPYLEDGAPRLRILPPDRFIVYSANEINPTLPTHFVEIMGTVKNSEGHEKTIFYAYTKDEFLAFDEDENILTDRMAALENVEGVNSLGALPGIYINRSKHCLIPKPDTDTLAMTKLIPVLFTDLNYALMYQVFSLLYTIDVDQSNLKVGPSALLDLKSSAGLGAEAKPEIGVVKPDVDSDKALAMIKALFSLWMETRNIKPGAMGALTAENAASGFAKVIDEMDTSEDRQAQVAFFKKAEQALWKLILEKYHPYWLDTEPEFKFKGLQFSKTAQVKVTFAEQRPNVDPAQATQVQKTQMDMGIQSRRGALKVLYPDWTDKQVDERLAEVEKERSERQAENQAAIQDAKEQQNSDARPGFPPKAKQDARPEEVSA